LDRFEGIQTQVLGLSVDSVPCLTAWAESLGGITYPLLSDFYPHGETARSYGVLRPDGTSERAIFVIDKEGAIRYIDVHAYDEQPDNEVLFRVLEELEPQAAALYKARQQKEPASVEPASETLVKLYCTPWCPACRRARAYLREHEIPFTEINIAHDREAARQVRSWANGNETTPAFQIGERIIIEFRRAELDELLGIVE
jgi:glutaredoxin